MNNLKDILDVMYVAEPLGDKRSMDIRAIKAYLLQDECYLDGITMLEDVIKFKLEQYDRKIGSMEWLRYPTEYYYNFYPKEAAYKFDLLTRRMIMGESVSESNIEWLKENVPKLKKPTSGFWRPLYEYITSDLGLSFKEKNKED